MYSRLIRRRVPAWSLLAALVLLAACARVEDAALDAGIEADRARSGVDVHTVAAGDYDVHYLERAGDGPTLVLVHGFGAEKDIWLALIRELPESWRIVVPDLPGHGATATPPDDQPLSVAWYAQQLHAFITALDLQQPHVVGSSMGGLIAIRHALEYPDPVSRLGLLSPAGVQPAESSDLELMLDSGDNALIVRDRADFERLLALVYHEPPAVPWPARPALIRRMSNRGPFLERLWNELYERGEFVEDELEGLAAPALVIWGARDRVIDVSGADVFARLVPEVEVQVLDNVGHSPMTEAPARTARLIAAFITDPDRAAGAPAE